MQADDGTYMEEPGSGAVASVGKKILSVGTLVWVRRYNEKKMEILWCK